MFSAVQLYCSTPHIVEKESMHCISHGIGLRAPISSTHLVMKSACGVYDQYNCGKYCPSDLPGGNNVPFDVDFSDDDGSQHEIGVTAAIPGTSQSLTSTVRFQQTQSTRMWVMIMSF